MKKRDSAHLAEVDIEQCNVVVDHETGTRVALCLRLKEVGDIAFVVDLRTIHGLRAALTKAEEFLLATPGTA